MSFLWWTLLPLLICRSFKHVLLGDFLWILLIKLLDFRELNIYSAPINTSLVNQRYKLIINCRRIELIGYWSTLQRIMTASATEVYAVVPLELKPPFSRGKLDLFGGKNLRSKTRFCRDFLWQADLLNHFNFLNVV